MLTTSRVIVRAIRYTLLLLLLMGCTPITTQPPDQAAPVRSSTEQDEPIAILTYVVGEVFVQEPFALRRAPGLMAQTPPTAETGETPATAFQELRDGSTVRAAPGGAATIVCYGNQAYQVSGGTQVPVNSASCNSAPVLPVNSAVYVAPSNGRLVENDGSAVLEGETREREGDYGQLPIILSPRNTAVLALTPTIHWVDVNGALEYELSLSGLAAFDDIILAADKLTCHDDARTAPNRICTEAWPAQWVLEPDQRYFLTVSARTGIAAPLRDSEASAVRTLPTAEAEQLQSDVAAIGASALDPVTSNLLLAGRYREHGLLDSAIGAYEAAFVSQPDPVTAIALGDLYLAIGLQRFAFLAYQNALDVVTEQAEGNLAVQAAAEFGIGLVYFSRDNFAEAEPHFVQAIDLYAQIGAQSAQEATQHALQETQKRRS